MGIKAYKQLEAGTVTLTLLAVAIQAKIAKIEENETAILAINNAKGAASGFAPLDANSKVPAIHMPSIAIGNTFAAASEAEMLVAQSTDKAGDDVAVEMGDVMIRSDQGGTSYKLAGTDPTDMSNWVKLFNAEDGVTEVTVGGVSHTGSVALSNLAASGDVADLTGLSNVATSGAAADIALVDTGSLFAADNSEEAFAELMGKLNQEVNDRQSATSSAVTSATMVTGAITGVQDDSNTAYVIANIDTSKPMFFFRDGVEQLSSGFATNVGSNVTAVISAPAADEAMKVYGYPN